MCSDSSIPLILGITRSRKTIPRTYPQESVETGFWICCHQDINTCLFQRGANHFQVFGAIIDGEQAAAEHNAVILEAIARMAYFTLGINSAAQPVKNTLHDKHYLRKHGRNAYYGQAKDGQ
jgi:hypothetical protein